jgi:hypothetical protein
MPRNYPDWLAAYTQFASFSEAPKRMHFGLAPPQSLVR